MWTVTFIVTGAGWRILRQLLHLWQTEKCSNVHIGSSRTSAFTAFTTMCAGVIVSGLHLIQFIISQWLCMARKGQVKEGRRGGWCEHNGICDTWIHDIKWQNLPWVTYRGTDETQWPPTQGSKHSRSSLKGGGRVTVTHPRVYWTKGGLQLQHEGSHGLKRRSTLLPGVTGRDQNSGVLPTAEELTLDRGGGGLPWLRHLRGAALRAQDAAH